MSFSTFLHHFYHLKVNPILSEKTSTLSFNQLSFKKIEDITRININSFGDLRKNTSNFIFISLINDSRFQINLRRLVFYVSSVW